VGSYVTLDVVEIMWDDYPPSSQRPASSIPLTTYLLSCKLHFRLLTFKYIVGVFVMFIHLVSETTMREAS
jgi:hypothetical protein